MKHNLLAFLIVVTSPSLFALEFFCGSINSNYVFIRNSKPSVVAGFDQTLEARIHIPSEKIMYAQYDCSKSGMHGEYAKVYPTKAVSPIYACKAKHYNLPTVRLEIAYFGGSSQIGADELMVKLFPSKKMNLTCKDLK
jgi:hypothetical protein